MAKLTPEEVVAKKLMELMKDVTLDLEMVGEKIALTAPVVLHNRLQLIVETAHEQKVKKYDQSKRDNHYEQMRNPR